MLLWFFFEHYSVGLAFASKLAYLSHYQPYSVFSLNINPDENTTLILVAKYLRDLAHQDKCCENHQFNSGMYILANEDSFSPLYMVVCGKIGPKMLIFSTQAQMKGKQNGNHYQQNPTPC